MKRLLYIFWAIKIALPYTGLCQEAKLFVKLGHTGAINSIAFSPDGQFLISGSEDNTIRLWDLKSGEWKRIFKGHGEAVSSVLFSADGKTIFSGSHDRTAKLWNLENGELIRTYEGHKGRILDIAIKDSLLITASDDQTAKVWSITSGKRIASISHIGLVYCVAVMPGQAFMAASGTSAMKEVSHEGSMLVSVKTFLPVGVIKMWTLTPFGTSGAMDLGANIQAPEPMSYEYALSFSPDGKYLVAGTGVGTIDIWNPLKSELLRQIRHSKSPVFAVRVSPDGQKIASAGADGKIRIWSLESGDLLKEMGTGSTGSLRCVAYSPDGHYLASGGDDNNIYLWNVDSAKTELTMRGKICGINSIAFSPDGKYLATGSMDMTVKLWSVPSGDLVSTQIGHLGNVNSVTFSPDGRKLASGGHDKMIRLWDIPSGTQTTKFSEMGAVNSLSFYSDGQFLASAISGELTTGWGGLFKDEFQKKVVGITLKVWSVEAIKVNESWEEGSAHAVSYSPNSKYLAFGVAGKKLHPYIEDSYVLVFDLRQQLKASKLGGFGLKVCSVAFSQNEQYLGAASADGMVKIWETTKWKEKKKLTAHKSQINSIVFSPDGKYFVTGGQDGLVKFWQTESAKLERQIDFHDGPVKSVAFSPDGRYLASGSMDGSVCFWDTETGNMTMRLVAFILNQYVAYTNENYFRCSPLAEEFIHFKVGDDIYKLSDYKQKFGWQNQPEKVALK